MSAKKRPYSGNARFLELGSLGQPFRTLINIDHLTNCRYEQKIEMQEIPKPGGAPAKPAQYDDAGEMVAPPQAPETEQIPVLAGFNIVLVFGSETQAIFFNDEDQSVTVYNTILDMIAGTGVPIARMPKLTPQPPEEEPSKFLGPDGAPLGAGNDDDDTPAPGEVPDLTDEELDQLENPEIDVDAIADAVDQGVDDDRPN